MLMHTYRITFNYLICIPLIILMNCFRWYNGSVESAKVSFPQSVYSKISALHEDMSEFRSHLIFFEKVFGTIKSGTFWEGVKNGFTNWSFCAFTSLQTEHVGYRLSISLLEKSMI